MSSSEPNRSEKVEQASDVDKSDRTLAQSTSSKRADQPVRSTLSESLTMSTSARNGSPSCVKPSQTSSSTSSTAQPGQATVSLPSKHLKEFISKHLPGEVKQVEDNFAYMRAYHQKFIDSIDPILKRSIPKMIFDMKEFAELRFTSEIENQMIKSLQADLDSYFPVPSTDKEIDELINQYRNCDIGLDHSNESQLPEYYQPALYLPKGVMPENDTIANIYEELRSKAQRISEHLGDLLYGVQLLEPALADSDNTGQWVQLQVRQWTVSVWNSTAPLIYLAHSYRVNRMSMLTQVFTYRQIEDIRLAYIQWERSNFREVRQTVEDLWANLLLLHHSIMKHIDKVMTPRGTHLDKMAAKITN